MFSRAIARGSVGCAGVLWRRGGSVRHRPFAAWPRSFATAAPQMDVEAMKRRAEELQEEGEAFLAREEYSKAGARLSAAVNLLQDAGGDAVRPRLGLAFAYHCEGKLDDAEANYRSAIEVLAKEGDQDMSLATAKTNLADLLSHKEDVEGAEAVLREALPLIEKAHGEGELLAAALQNLATYLAVQNRFDDAIEPAERALALFEEHVGRHNAYTQGTLRTILRIYLDKGDQEKHDALKAKWAGADTSDLAEAEELCNSSVREHLVEKMQSVWNLEEAKKSLDPAGAMMPMDILKKEIEVFQARWGPETDNGKGLEAKDEAFVEKFEAELEDLKGLVHKSAGEDRPGKSPLEGLSPEDLERMNPDNPNIHQMDEEEMLSFAKQFEGKHEVDLDIASLGFSPAVLKAAGLSSASASTSSASAQVENEESSSAASSEEALDATEEAAEKADDKKE